MSGVSGRCSDGRSFSVAKGLASPAVWKMTRSIWSPSVRRLTRFASAPTAKPANCTRVFSTAMSPLHRVVTTCSRAHGWPRISSVPEAPSSSSRMRALVSLTIEGGGFAG